MGKLEFLSENKELAKNNWKHAINLYEKTGDSMGKANCQRYLGKLEFLKGNEKDGINFLKIALIELQETQSLDYEIECLVQLGECLSKTDEEGKKEAKSYFETALEKANQLNVERIINEVKDKMAECLDN